MKKQRRVLKDHKQVGTKLVPPFLDAFQQFKEVPHVKLVVPELIWLGAFNDILGPHEGARLCLEIARASARRAPNLIMATCTAYRSLTEEDWREVIQAIAAQDRNQISAASAALGRLYPEFPLRPMILESDLSEDRAEQDIEWLSNILPSLFDKTSVEAVGMMANATYIAFCTDKLKASSDTSLAQFPEIERYPDTELSQRVAAAIRCFTNSLVGGMPEEPSRDWPRYFWNRGLELAPCLDEVSR
jgi:hypothetical protein